MSKAQLELEICVMKNAAYIYSVTNPASREAIQVVARICDREITALTYACMQSRLSKDDCTALLARNILHAIDRLR